METMQAIRSRRSVRSYEPEPPTIEQIEDVIGAAVCAPSDLNRQPWSFLAVRGADHLAELEKKVQAAWLGGGDRHLAIAHDSEVSAAVRGMIDSGFTIFHGASAVIVLLAPVGDEAALLDTALAAQNLMLAASDLGLATCPAAMSHAYFEHPDTMEELALPAGLRVVLAVVLGTPAVAPSDGPGRRDPVIHWR